MCCHFQRCHRRRRCRRRRHSPSQRCPRHWSGVARDLFPPPKKSPPPAPLTSCRLMRSHYRHHHCYHHRRSSFASTSMPWTPLPPLLLRSAWCPWKPSSCVKRRQLLKVLSLEAITNLYIWSHWRPFQRGVWDCSVQRCETLHIQA
jgi:hypothetical protein